MRTELCKKLDLESPIFAFTHCRDVVVAVSKAGGIGVLGAVGFSPDKLRWRLNNCCCRVMLAASYGILAT